VIEAREGRTLGGISVSVCNYNGAAHLQPCLDALRAQTRPFDELLVVDNASSDGSAALVRERYPEARLIELAENRGPCPARNAGLREARHGWVLLVDNDAVLAPDVLEKLERAALAHPRAALVQPRSVFASEPSRVHYDGGGLHYVGLFSLRNFHRPLAEAEGAGALEVGGAVSVVLLAEREALLEAGGFDEAYFILFEDLDLSLRLRMEGRTIVSVEDALVLHRGGTAGISFRGGRSYPRQRAFFHSRNRWLHLAKNYRWRTLLAIAPALALYELAWLVFTLRSRTLLGHLEGKLAFVLGSRECLKKRRDVQRRRKVRDRDLLVGGPLTVAPDLARGAASRKALSVLDRCLSSWWALARRWCG